MSLATPLSISIPARPGIENEDAVRIGPGLAVVVDGAGVAQQYRSGCRHSVAWYSHHLADAMFEAFADPATPPREALAGAIAHVRGLHGPDCRLDRGSPSATMAAFRVFGDELEYLVICDAAILLVHHDGTTTQVTDRRIESAQALVEGHRAELRAQGADEETVFVQGWARAEQLRNHPDGFWCPREDPAVAQYALVGRVGLGGLRAAIACSDGITRASERLGIHDVDSLAAAIVGHPLEQLVDAIRRAEAAAEPPARGGKRHDDATAAVLAW